jgi:transcriptional regulator with XRE-family HTH domain
MRRRANETEYEQLVEEERLILEASELIHQLMDERHVSRSGLAKLIGKSKGHISQLLDGRRNMTLRTLARLAYALDHRLGLDARPLAMLRRSSAPVLASNLDTYVFLTKRWMALTPSGLSSLLPPREDLEVWPSETQRSHATTDERVAAAA